MARLGSRSRKKAESKKDSESKKPLRPYFEGREGADYALQVAWHRMSLFEVPRGEGLANVRPMDLSVQNIRNLIAQGHFFVEHDLIYCSGIYRIQFYGNKLVRTLLIPDIADCEDLFEETKYYKEAVAQCRVTDHLAEEERQRQNRTEKFPGRIRNS